MTTYYDEAPNLFDRIRHADFVGVISDWKIERIASDPMSQAERQIVHVLMFPERTLRGEPVEAILVRVVRQAGKEGAPSTIDLESPKRVFAMLQRDADGAFVPYFDSLFAMKGDEIRLPPDLQRERPDPKRRLTLASITRLIRRIDQETAAAEKDWHDQEPRPAAIPDVSEAPEEFGGARPAEYGPPPARTRRSTRR